MRYTARTLSTVLLVVIGLSSVGSDAMAWDQRRATIVAGITVIGGSANDHEMVRWAADRFRQAGFELHPVVVHFNGNDRPCDGHDGLFRSRGDAGRVDVCTHNRYIVLHELAHAWDHTNLSDGTRAAVMDLFGIETWNDKNQPWKERGIEVLAEVITWGLYEHPVAGSTGKAAAFRLITGRDPRHPATTEAAISGAAVRPSGWDELL